MGATLDSLSHAGGWTTFGFTVLFLFVFSFLFTRYYQDRREAEWLATGVTILGLFFCLATVAITPVDVYLVSSTSDPDTGLKNPWANPDKVVELVGTIKAAYYTFYAGVAIFSFAVIPFAYFYFEEYEEEQPTHERVKAAVTYTMYMLAIIALLLLVGFFVYPSQTDRANFGWFRNLLTPNGAERSVTFTMAVMMTVGMLIYVTYTAYGLCALPIGMVRGMHATAEDSLEIQAELATNRERQQAICAKYTSVSALISAKDKKILKELKQEERILLRQSSAISRQRRGFLNKCLGYLRPIEFTLGVAFLTLSALIFVSILLNSVDKAMNTLCGSNCGYILSQPLLINPINHIYLKLAKLFPLDYIFFVSIIIYFVICTMSGIVNIGIRFFWVNMFRIRKGSTPPQALLFTTVILMLSLLALNYIVISVITPQYAQFGTQKYCNLTTTGTTRPDCTEHQDHIVPCDVTAPPELCTPTALSDLISRITVNTPFFGSLFYYAQWAFMAVFLLGAVWAGFRRRRPGTEDDEVEEDEQALLAARQRSTGNRQQGLMVTA